MNTRAHDSGHQLTDVGSQGRWVAIQTVGVILREKNANKDEWMRENSPIFRRKKKKKKRMECSFKLSVSCQKEGKKKKKLNEKWLENKKVRKGEKEKLPKRKCR